MSFKRTKVYKKNEDVRLSKNFHLSEFQCQCKNSDCHVTLVDEEQVEKLQELRDRIKKPIHITSGYRCQKHNSAVGGSKNSKHLLGKATDIKVSGLTPLEIHPLAIELGFKGIGVYTTFIHLDNRDSDRLAEWHDRQLRAVS